MRLYDNSYPSIYEEFKTYYPVWYRDILEMDAIWQAYGIQMDSVQQGITQAVNNNFIMKMDEANISKLERFLYITYDDTRTLNERRTMVASFYIGHGHFGEREIKEILSLFTAGEVTVDLIGGTVEISVTRDMSDRFNLSDCLFIMLKRIPAHLGLVFRDILLPTPFENRHGFKFNSLVIHSQFSNRGRPLPILLDGQRTFDGSWLLNQAYPSISMPSVTFATTFNGGSIRPIMFERVPRRAQNTIHAPFASFSTFPIPNSFRSRAKGLSVVVDLHNEESVRGDAVRFDLQARQEYSLGGSITMDSMYTLDDSVLLDGSRKLNAEIVKEEI